ncbi:MAG: hypothetical protein ACYTGZ_17930, partial [Planctomycetota bacterium]
MFRLATGGLVLLAASFMPATAEDDSGSGSNNNSENSSSGDSSSDSRGERVRGRAYSATDTPPVIDDPPDEFLASADEKAENEPTAYTGLDDYELKEDHEHTDKRSCASTDYIRWTAQGATLKAEGQIHDAHADKTSRVSSQAWGAQTTTAEIKAEEGAEGTISAENRISFSYSHTISGPSILEATVLLSGTCVDIKGESHSFNLSDSRSESVAVGTRETTTTTASGKHTTRATVSAGTLGGRAEGSATTSVELSEGDVVDVSVSTVLGQAGGDAGGQSAPLISDSVSGPTPLKKTYSVYSAGGVVLAAKGSRVDGRMLTTTVILQEFKIENTLRVFKKAVDVTEPTDPEMPSGGPTSGGGSGGGGAGGGDSGGPDAGEPGAGGESGEGAGGEGSDDAASDDELEGNLDGGGIGGASSDGTRRESAPMSLDGLDGLDGIAVRAVTLAPFGIVGESGSHTGELHVILNEPAEQDLKFAVQVDPSDGFRFLQGETVTIRAGSLGSGGSIEALVVGTAFVSLHLLDANGGLTGRELAVPVEGTSTAARDEPTLYACGDGDAWHAGTGATIRGLRGSEAPELIVGRLGFAEYATEATRIEISVSDPKGVLPPMPESITIPAGESEARIGLQLQDVEGSARIGLRAGDQEIAVHVVSRTQSWSGVSIVRIPLGAIAPVPMQLRWSERTDRVVMAHSLQPGVASIAAESAEVRFYQGMRFRCVPVRGQALGPAVVRLESDGLPPLQVPVEVVPARVMIDTARIRLVDLPTGTSGTISITAPPGVVFDAIEIPPEAVGCIEVSGIGSSHAVLAVKASPDFPADLSLGVELSGAPEGGRSIFDVDERLE